MPLTLGGWILGIALGLRHALEPDHLTALSTLVVEGRRHRSAGLLLGMVWGAGHTLGLLLLGGLFALLQRRIPQRLADGLELGVAVMLFLLGARALHRSIWERAPGPPAAHSHRGVPHVHAGGGEHVHLGGRSLGVRPLLVGLVHGLAGSGAMTALLLAHQSTPALRLAYILFFGLGSVVGMGLLTAAAGASLSQLLHRRGFNRMLLAATGALSCVLGLTWGTGPLSRLAGA